MIAIVNMGSCRSDCDGTGIHEYELRINNRVIVTFEHLREEGLVVCLRAAAEAVENETKRPRS